MKLLDVHDSCVHRYHQRASRVKSIMHPAVLAAALAFLSPELECPAREV